MTLGKLLRALPQAILLSTIAIALGWMIGGVLAWAEHQMFPAPTRPCERAA